MWRMENHSGFLRNSSDVMQTSTWAKFLINLFAAEKEVVLPRVDVSHFCSRFSFFLFEKTFSSRSSFKWYFHLSRKEWFLRQKTLTTFPQFNSNFFYYTFDSFLFSPTDCKCKIEAQRLNHNKFCKRDYGELYIEGRLLREIDENVFQLFLIRWMFGWQWKMKIPSTNKNLTRLPNKRKRCGASLSTRDFCWITSSSLRLFFFSIQFKRL